MLGVELDCGFIKMDVVCCINVFGFYVIGDVVGLLCLVYKVSYEGVFCVEILVGVEGVYFFDCDYVSGCIYVWFQVVSLGLMELMVLVRGWFIRIGKFFYQSNGKVLVSGEIEGFVKMIFDVEIGELLGVYMVGVQVMEQIQGFGIVCYLEVIDESFLLMIFVYLIFFEVMYELIFVVCD